MLREKLQLPARRPVHGRRRSMQIPGFVNLFSVQIRQSVNRRPLRTDRGRQHQPMLAALLGAGQGGVRAGEGVAGHGTTRLNLITHTQGFASHDPGPLICSHRLL